MSPERRGVPTNLTLEPEAREMLREMSGGHTFQGKVASLCIRQEYQRRIEVRRLREKLCGVVEEVLTA